MKKNLLKSTQIDTPLGKMMAIANDDALYLLEFIERRGLEREIARFRYKTRSTIVSGITPWIESIEKELRHYFANQLSEFKIPVCLFGTPFQQRVWGELKKIPFGETRSYSDIAIAIGQPQATRAVGRANASNQLALLIPCHRVINKNGNLGGYAGVVKRKKWLLEHEMSLKNGLAR